MVSKLSSISVSSLIRAFLLAGSVVLFAPTNLHAEATEPNASQVLCREQFSIARREQLARQLRKITGWSFLKFDQNGRLQTSHLVEGGSQTARDLLTTAISGGNIIIVEDASHSSAVAFARVIPGKWQSHGAARPPAFVVQIDFADFEQIVGDKQAVASFNAAWAVLHELEHIVNDSNDAVSLGETGACEALINKMRRECNLPERTEYFFTVSPLSSDVTFTTRLVRLAFEERQSETNKKRRYWLTWDLNSVGGFERDQVVALR
jgi:hypothetical protein